MKKLFGLLSLVFIFAAAVAQTPNYDSTKTPANQPVPFTFSSLLKPLAAFVLPHDTLHLARRDSGAIAGINGILYRYNGYYWPPVNGGSIDSAVYMTVSRWLTDSALFRGLINLKVDKTTTITINGVPFDLSTNRTWNVGTLVGGDTISLHNVLYGKQDSMITCTKSIADTLIKYYLLKPGVFYKITGTHTALYNDGTTPGTTIILQATAQNGFALSGKGIFFNPKYVNATVGFGICDTSATFSVGDSTIWGHYRWVCNSAGKPTATSVTNLGSTFTKVPYSSGVYWTVYDDIEYDYTNNLIVRRRESDVGNEVYAPRTSAGSGIYINGQTAIGVFQWGNKQLNESTGKGMAGNIIQNSYVECVNFRGSRFSRNQFINNAVWRTNYMGINSLIEHNVINSSTVNGNRFDSLTNISGNVFIKAAINGNIFNMGAAGNGGLQGCFSYGSSFQSTGGFTSNYCYKGTYANVTLNNGKIVGDSIVSNTTPSSVGYSNVIVENASITGGKRTAGLLLNSIIRNYQLVRTGITYSTADSFALEGSKNFRYPNIAADAVNAPTYLMGFPASGDSVKRYLASSVYGVNLGSNDLTNIAAAIRIFDNAGKSLYFTNTGLFRIIRTALNYGFTYDFNKTLSLNNYDSLNTTGIEMESGTRLTLYWKDLNNLDTASKIDIGKVINIQSKDSVIFSNTDSTPNIVLTPTGIMKDTRNIRSLYTSFSHVNKGWVDSILTAIAVPTLQQVLNSGSALTANNLIYFPNKDLIWQGKNFRIDFSNGSGSPTRFTADSAHIAIGVNSRAVEVSDTAIKINTQTGKLYIDSLNRSSAANDSAMVWNPVSKKVANRVLVTPAMIAQMILDSASIVMGHHIGKYFDPGTNTLHLYADTVATINPQSASYTLTIADQFNSLVEISNGSANNLTVPLNSSVAFPIGTSITIVSTGAGQTTFVATGGVTINSSGGKLKLTGQWSSAVLIKTGTNTWTLIGDLTT